MFGMQAGVLSKLGMIDTMASSAEMALADNVAEAQGKKEVAH